MLLMPCVYTRPTHGYKISFGAARRFTRFDAILRILGRAYVHETRTGDDEERMPTTQAEKGRRFQALHARAGAFVIPNPWDAGTARILTALGFEALTTTSAGLA